MKNEKKDSKKDQKPQPKKTYTQPEVKKHGDVEALTQGAWNGPSGPIQTA